MKNYCLKVNELFDVLNWREHEVPIGCNKLALELEEARCWVTKLTCLALLFARIMERDKLSPEALKKKIAVLYSMSDEFWFEIQEGNDVFVEYLLNHLRENEDTLEDTLVEIQNRLSEYNYEKTICY